MKLAKTQLVARDRKRNISEDVLRAIKDINAGRTGRIIHVEVSKATEVRLELSLS